MKKKLILVLLGILIIQTSLVIAIPSGKVPHNIEDRINKNINPAPFDKIKAPLSEIANFVISNKQFTKNMPKLPIIDPVQTSTSTAFNKESGNLPQMDQAITLYTPSGSSTTLVVGGASDYRGFYGLLQGVSGYYVSNDNGASTLREGALPSLTSKTDDNVKSFTALSAGEPSLDTYRKDGTIYYTSLYQDFTGGTDTNAIALAKSTPTNLTNTGIPDSSVWKVGKVRADSGSSPQYNDKPWVGVDNSGITSNIYVTWTVFDNSAGSAKIWMSSCNSSLVCNTIHNNLNAVSGTQTNTQMSKVSVDSMGRVIITWIEYNLTNPNPPYYSINLWYRVFASGGINPLTNPVLIKTLAKPIDGYNALQGNTFRITQNIWSEVGLAGNVPRLFVVYTECGGSYLYDIPIYTYADACSNANTYLRYIDNYSGVKVISSQISLEVATNIHSFFPTMSVNQPANRLDIAWYQSESTYKHDLYLAQQQRNMSAPSIITQLTSTLYASDPSADVYFNGGNIGDYFQIKTESGNPNEVFAHYAGNPKFSLPILYNGFGNPFPFKLGGNQEDNILNVKIY